MTAFLEYTVSKLKTKYAPKQNDATAWEKLAGCDKKTRTKNWNLEKHKKSHLTYAVKVLGKTRSYLTALLYLKYNAWNSLQGILVSWLSYQKIRNQEFKTGSNGYHVSSFSTC